MEAPVGLAGSSGYSEITPPESCAAPATLLGFCAPTTTSTRRSTQPGLPTPVRSAFRVSHPPDGLLPPRLPASRTGAARGVHPPERFPPAEPYAFGACALLLFLASRSLALRTRRSRCPAAPRLCSLRRSVPGQDLGEPRFTRADALMGFSASPERSPDAARSASRPLPSCTSTDRLPRRSNGRYSRALTNIEAARPVRDDQLP
jgi:hypothetical protein